MSFIKRRQQFLEFKILIDNMTLDYAHKKIDMYNMPSNIKHITRLKLIKINFRRCSYFNMCSLPWNYLFDIEKFINRKNFSYVHVHKFNERSKKKYEKKAKKTKKKYDQKNIKYKKQYKPQKE